jgi:hypothetical protein
LTAGRPQGRNKFPSAVSLTQQQIEWMHQQPNASELIGKLIDALMLVDKFSPESFHTVQLKIVLDELQSKLSSTRSKRIELMRVNAWHFKQTQETYGGHTNCYIENFDNPEPIDDDGKIIKITLTSFDESIKQLENEIANKKFELLKTPIEFQLQHA